jgi:hypothetical protein
MVINKKAYKTVPIAEARDEASKARTFKAATKKAARVAKSVKKATP